MIDPAATPTLNKIELFAWTHLDVAPSDLVTAFGISKHRAERWLRLLVELRRMKRVAGGLYAFGSDLKPARRERGAA